MESDVLLNDRRLLILTQEVAEQIGRRLESAMYQQAHPLSRPSTHDVEKLRANQYGAKAVLKFNASTSDVNAGIRQQATIVDWQSPDGQAHSITVEVGRINTGGGGSFPLGTDNTGTPLSYRANAQVIYGTRGAMQAPFFVDINRGQRFTVTASYVAVTAQMIQPPATYNSGSLAVFGTLGVGITPSLSPVFVTTFEDNATTSPLVIPIPEKANRLMPVRTANNSSLTIDFLDNSGAVVDTLGLFASGSMITPADLAQDIFSARVTPTVNPTTYRLVWQLQI